MTGAVRLTEAAGALAAGDIDAALGSYRRVLAEDAANEVTAQLGLAVCHARRRQWDEATTALRLALDQNPACGLAYAYLGAVRFEQGDVTRALADLDQAVALAPTEAVVHLKRAELLLRLGRLGDADDACRQAIAEATDPVLRDTARTLLLGVRRERGGALPREIPSPVAGVSRVTRGLRHRVVRASRRVAIPVTLEGGH